MSEKNKSNADSALWHDPLSRYLSEFHEHFAASWDSRTIRLQE